MKRNKQYCLQITKQDIKEHIDKLRVLTHNTLLLKELLPLTSDLQLTGAIIINVKDIIEYLNISKEVIYTSFKELEYYNYIKDVNTILYTQSKEGELIYGIQYTHTEYFNEIREVLGYPFQNIEVLEPIIPAITTPISDDEGIPIIDIW